MKKTTPPVCPIPAGPFVVAVSWYVLVPLEGMEVKPSWASPTGTVRAVVVESLDASGPPLPLVDDGSGNVYALSALDVTSSVVTNQGAAAIAAGRAQASGVLPGPRKTLLSTLTVSTPAGQPIRLTFPEPVRGVTVTVFDWEPS